MTKEIIFKTLWKAENCWTDINVVESILPATQGNVFTKLQVDNLLSRCQTCFSWFKLWCLKSSVEKYHELSYLNSIPMLPETKVYDVYSVYIHPHYKNKCTKESMHKFLYFQILKHMYE